MIYEVVDKQAESLNSVLYKFRVIGVVLLKHLLWRKRQDNAAWVINLENFNEPLEVIVPPIDLVGAVRVFLEPGADFEQTMRSKPTLVSKNQLTFPQTKMGQRL